MPRFSMESIRNVCLVGHTGTGKTTLFEALLHAAGALSATGSVERGTTVSDYDPMEKERSHSLNTVLASVDFRDTHINLIDTPGLSDFRGPTFAAMASCETVAIVINAQVGLDRDVAKLVQRARARGNECLLIINRIDVPGVKLEQLLSDLRSQIGSECLPLNLPAKGRRGVLDCFYNSAGDADFSSVATAHQQIIDQVVEINPEVMDHYLEEGEAKLSRTELHDAFEQCLRESHLLPVLFTSARTGVGIRELLEVIVNLLPNPKEGNPPRFLIGEGKDAQPAQTVADPAKHVVAHVFKIINDPFVGKLSLFRIYQGSVRKDTQLYLGDGRKAFRVAHLFKLFGKEHSEIELGVAGDICAIAKVEEMHYDGVLHDSHDEDHWHLAPLDLPQPMFGLSVQPASRGHEQKLSSALAKLSEEDPCFVVEHRSEVNETVVRGLGELHLKVMLARLAQRFQVEVKTAPPRIAYRETISQAAEGHHRHKKQTGGAGQFGEVFLRVTPLARGQGFSFSDDSKGGSIPHSLIPAVEKGVRLTIQAGAIAGYPLQDIAVSAYDGKHHPVDSKEVAFVSAGKKALLDAISKARPLVLEPIVNLEVTMPEGLMGEVTSGLSIKRAKIAGTDAAGSGELKIRAQVPLSELSDYMSELKAQTAGQGSYTLELSHYEPVPAGVQKQLMEAYKPRVEED